MTLSASKSATSITDERQEIKYLLGAATGRELAVELNNRLPKHHFKGPGARPLPGAQHWVTTVYFDTADRKLFRQAKSQGGGLKVRAKEYYDEHPGLAQTARDRRELVRHAPLLWVELKLSREGQSGKRRVGIPKTEVPHVFEQGRISERIVEIQREAYGEEADEILAELEELRARFDSPLRATALVNYRRDAWQDEAASLRVTVDRRLAFFRPPEDLWSSSDELHRRRLGSPVRSQEGFVLEIKSVGPQPDWLAKCLERLAIRATRFSKFLAAGEAMGQVGA